MAEFVIFLSQKSTILTFLGHMTFLGQFLNSKVGTGTSRRLTMSPLALSDFCLVFPVTKDKSRMSQKSRSVFCPEGAFVQESLKNPMCVCPFVRPVVRPVVRPSVTLFLDHFWDLEICKTARKYIKRWSKKGSKRGQMGTNPGDE